MGGCPFQFHQPWFLPQKDWIPLQIRLAIWPQCHLFENVVTLITCRTFMSKLTSQEPPRKPKSGSRLPKKGELISKPLVKPSYGTISQFLRSIDFQTVKYERVQTYFSIPCFYSWAQDSLGRLCRPIRSTSRNEVLACASQFECPICQCLKLILFFQSNMSNNVTTSHCIWGFCQPGLLVSGLHSTVQGKRDPKRDLLSPRDGRVHVRQETVLKCFGTCWNIS